MEPGLAARAQGYPKQALNLMDYRDSLRKTIRYRPTRKRRQPDDAQNVENDNIPGDIRTGQHPQNSAPNSVLNVTFNQKDDRGSGSLRTKRNNRHRNLAAVPYKRGISGFNAQHVERTGSLPPNSLAPNLAIERRRASSQLDNLPLALNDDISGSWESRDKSNTITSEHEFLAWIVDEIQQSTAGVGRPRHTSYFFNIVLGGNVHLVKNVLRYLKKFRMKNELTWVLGATPKEYSENVTCRPTVCMRVFHVMAYIFWAVLFIILTPIFYTLHIMVYMAHLNTRGRMSLAIQLPLVFAVLSEDPDMIQVFLDAGCPLDGEDLKGNNVYHYLADLSLDDPEKAVRCHLILCAGVDNLSYIKTLITEKKNRLGITALEAIAKYGSTHFLRFIMVDKSCIGSLRLSVSKDALWADFKNDVYDIKGSEVKSIDTNSFSTARDDTESEASLNVWEFDISRYEMGDAHGNQSYLLQLVSSRSVDSMSEIDVWGFMQSKLLQKWISVKFKTYLPLAVLSHMIYLVITGLVLVFIIDRGGDVDPAPLFSIFLRYDTEEVIKAGHTIFNMTDTTSDDMSVWDMVCMGWDITWDDEVVSMALEHNIRIDNCSATALAKVKESCESMDSMTLLSQTLNRSLEIEAGVVDVSPSRMALDYLILIHIVLDVIIRQGFLLRNYNFRASSPPHGIWPVLIRRFPGSYTEKQLSSMMYAFYGGYLLTHHLWYVTIYRRQSRFMEYFELLYSRNQSIDRMAKHYALAQALNEDLVNEEYISEIAGNLVMVCLMLRFIHTIHALRLLPGVGFFVITTKKMAKHLLQFTIVFLIVSLAFATIFFFVMREKECPANKIEGFDSLMTSLFSTYQVALGYGEYNFTGSLNARIAYVAYTIISMLLLLNLIIAVMTTTAEELNQVPWKQAMCCVERWDEILGTEVAVLTVVAPFRFLRTLIRSVRDKSCWSRRPVWENIRKTAKKTFEITYLK